MFARVVTFHVVTENRLRLFLCDNLSLHSFTWCSSKTRDNKKLLDPKTAHLHSRNFVSQGCMLGFCFVCAYGAVPKKGKKWIHREPAPNNTANIKRWQDRDTHGATSRTPALMMFFCSSLYTATGIEMLASDGRIHSIQHSCNGLCLM